VGDGFVDSGTWADSLTLPRMADPSRLRALDLDALAHGAGELTGQVEPAQLPRLWSDLDLSGASPQVVTWRARLQWRHRPEQPPQLWLDLSAQAQLPLTCQRCLAPVVQELEIERSFRFVESEDVAQAQDDECEEDLLVHQDRFDLLELIEDELLLSLPLVPLHERCPQPLVPQIPQPDDRPHPFAVLARLKKTD
jgi:uncharacterized protein